MADQGDVNSIVVPLSLGAFLIYTSLASLHIHLCVHAFAKYRQSALEVQKARIHYVRLMVLTLFLSTATYALDLALFYILTLNRETTRSSVELAFYLEVVFHICIGFTHLTADGLLVWRCYVIWTGNRLVGLAPLLPYAVSMVVGILNTVSDALCDGRDPTNAICRNHGLTLHRGLYYLVATSVNATATVLICIRLHRTRQRMRKVLVSMSGSNSNTTSMERVGGSLVPYTRVATVLIESALPFTLLGVAAAIVAFFDTTPAHHVRIFVAQLWTMASGLTAQVITYRVITGTSWTESRERDRYALSQSINFARRRPILSSSDPSGFQNDVP